MKSILKAISWFENGRPKMSAQKRDEIAAFYEKHKDKNIEVVFRVLPRRSSNQNRYLWGCIYPALTECLNEYGNEFDDEATHEFCKKRFNEKQVIGPGGEVIDTIGGTTTELNNEEFFNEYIEKIRRFMAEEFGRTVEDPGQQSIMFASYDNDLKTVIVE
jgi:hypothetical protein